MTHWERFRDWGRLSFSDRVEYGYNGTGRLVIADLLVPEVKLDYYQQETPTDGKDYDGFDRFGRVKDQYWDGYGTTSDVDRFHYGHDYAGNRTYRDIDSAIYGTDDKDQTYDYDDLHRLKDYQQGTYSGGSISSNESHRQQWGLDALGNWSAFKDDNDENAGWDLEQTRYHNKVNEIDGNSGDPITADPGDDWYDPTFDAGGDMVTGPKPGAPKDDDPDGRKLRHTYDAWNRLVEVEESPTDTTSWSILEQYEYDGRGRRIVKLTAFSGTVPQDTYDYYHNANWQVVEEHLDGDTTYPVSQYVWHPYYVDAPAVRWYDADTDGELEEENDGEYYYAHDANFNVTCLMDNGGTALERYHYTPYGRGTIYTGDWSSTRSSSLYSNPYLYTGREHDAETGLYYYRARYYHAQLGRFLSRDPIAYFGGGPNLYGYVRSMALVSVDPFGTDQEICFVHLLSLTKLVDEVVKEVNKTAPLPDWANKWLAEIASKLGNVFVADKREVIHCGWEQVGPPGTKPKPCYCCRLDSGKPATIAKGLVGLKAGPVTLDISIQIKQHVHYKRCFSLQETLPEGFKTRCGPDFRRLLLQYTIKAKGEVFDVGFGFSYAMMKWFHYSCEQCLPPKPEEPKK